jgi:hypothetical protein
MSLKHKVLSKIQFHKKEGKLIKNKIFPKTLAIRKQIEKYLPLMESDSVSSYAQN